MPHVQDKRSEGRGWVARYRTPDGSERSKSFARKVDAENWLTSQESSKLRGEWIDPELGKTTFDEWAGGWMGSTAHLKPKTRVGYEGLLNGHILPRFGGHAIARIEPLEVRTWVAELLANGLSASRVRQAYRLLSAILATAVESRYIGRTPCVGVKLPRLPKHEMRFLTAEQVAVLAAAMTRRQDALLVYVLAYGGLRWGEGVALRRRHCQLARLEVAEAATEIGGKITFGTPKTHERRFVATPAFLRRMLAEHLEPRRAGDEQELVFTAEKGGPVRHGNWYHRIWKPAVVRAGLPDDLRIHDLRHTCASLLIAQGANVKAVQKQLGHASAAMTLDRYAHLFPDEQDRLADALDAVWNASHAGRMRDERLGDVVTIDRIPAESAV